MKTLRKTAEEAYLNMQIKLLIVKHGQMVLYLVYNIKKNIHNLSSFAACCTTAVTPTASACVVYKTNNIYMKIFKYRLPSGKHILIYRSRDNKSSDYFQYVEEYTKKDIELPIFNEDTLFDTMQGKRTEDKILVENGIESIQDLSECYCQIRNKVSNLSKKVRDLVIKKYSDIINNYNFDK